MKHKSIVITLFVACSLTLCGGILTACSNGDKKLDVIESDDGYEWTYNQAFVDDMDEGMKIDGKLDESRWTDSEKNWLTHREQNVEMRYTTSFSEKGLYIAAEAKDARMQWNDTRAFLNNSSFFFYIISNEATEYHAFDCFGFYVDELHSACRQQTRFAAKASRNNSEIPTLTAEFFASWEALNYKVNEETGMPDSVRFIPAYRYVTEFGSKENTYLKPALAELGGNKVQNAYAFNGDGYINVDIEGAELGNGQNGFAKSDGWDLSNLASDQKTIRSNMYGDQAIFFKGIESSRYSYSVNIKYDKKILDGFPAAGVFDMKNATDFNIMRFNGDDYTGSDKKEFRYFLLDFHNNRSDKQYGFYTSETGNDVLNIRVIKDDTRYYYIFNGVYEFSVDLNWLGGKTVPGLYTFDAEVEFSDWEVTDYEGSEKDEAFRSLCAQYMHVIKLPSNISGGTITADKLAIAKDSGEKVQITVTPSRGYILTEFTVNGKSEYESVISEMENGTYELTPQSEIQIGAAFSALPTANTIRITGTVKRKNGSVHIGLPYSVKSSEDANKNLLYNYGTTTSAGRFDITLLKAGTYTIGDKTVVCDGKYTLEFEGIFPRGEQSSFVIDTTEEKYNNAIFTWDDIIVNPLKVSQMAENAEGKIQTTHTSYQSVIFSYYIENNTVEGSFQIDMTVNASNDKWPCYGITVEDENNNSVQFFAAGSNVYRIMSSYDGVNYKQYENKPATYINGESVQKLVYNEETDEFYFYVNGALFDTVKRSDYLTGHIFSYGPVGYMSGADGSNSAVTEENPYATFTKPVETKEFNLILPEGATLKTSDGVEITDGKVPVLSIVTVTIPVEDAFNYTIYVDGTPVETEMKEGKAVATFAVSANSTVTYKRAYSIVGKLQVGNRYQSLGTLENLSDVVVMAAGENGEILSSVKADNVGDFTLVLPDGTFYVAAEGKNLVSNAVQITVIEGTLNDELLLTLDQPSVTEQIFEKQLDYDVKSGNYCMNGAYGQKAGGYLAGASASLTDGYIVSVTMNGLGEEWPSGGFMVGTSPSKYVKFEIVKATESRKTYILRIKDAVTNGEALWWFDSIDEFKEYNSLEEFTLKLVYSNGMYYVFLENNLLVSVSEDLAIGSTTIKASVGTSDSKKIGLYGEQIISFKDWTYSFETSDIKAIIGCTVTLADGMTATVDGQTVTNGEVLLGDTVEISIAVPSGVQYNILVDGNAIETENGNGKAVARFKVTGNNVVSYAVAYEVSGSVTNGAEDTEIVIATKSGEIVYSTTGNTFEAVLSDGEYVVSAQGSDKVSGGISFKVNGAAQNISLQLDKLKLSGQIKNDWPAIAYDATTGTYKVSNENSYNNGSYFEGITAGETFVLKATILEFTGLWPSAGFAVQTEGGFVRFALRWRPEDDWKCYDSLSWNEAGQNTDRGKIETSPFVDGSTEIALIYNNGNYYFFVGGQMLFSESGYGEPIGKVGLFCERNITYTDWSYSAETNDISAMIGKTVQASDMKITVNGVAVTNGKVLLGDSVTVSIAVSDGQSVSILVDGKAVETTIADGNATATFTVTSDHAVTYAVAYRVAGTVTGGNAETLITIATDSGQTVYTGNGTSFDTNVSAGDYIVTACGNNYVSGGVKFTVTNVAVENIVVNLNQPKVLEYGFINQWGGPTGAFTNYVNGKGVYKTEYGTYWSGVLYGAEVGKDDSYILKAVVNLVSEDQTGGPSVGLALYSSSADNAANNVKFEIVHDGGSYYLRVRGNNIGGFVKNYNLTDSQWVQNNQEALKHNVSLMLVHNGGGYYLFVNGDLVLSLTGSDAADIDNAISGEGVKLGFYAEQETTYADWGWSTDKNEMSNLIGRTVSGEQITVAANGVVVTDGKVLLGDSVTVSIAISDGQSVSISVDGNPVETTIADGKATATFTVTKNHVITYGVSYSVSGVTSPNASVYFVNADGGEAASTAADQEGNYSVNLPNGTYYVSAETDTAISAVTSVTVNETAVSGCDIEVNRAKVTELLFGDKNLAFDKVSGSYKNDAGEPLFAGGYFADVTVAQGNDFELSLTMKDMGSPWASAGFIFGPSQTQFVRINLIRNDATDNFGLQVRNASGKETILWFADATALDNNPFAGEGGTLTFQLIYHAGWYNVYFNGKLVNRYDENATLLSGEASIKSSLDSGDIRFGIYAERAITFTDWDVKTADVDVPADARVTGFDEVDAFTFDAATGAFKSVWNNNNQRSVTDINVQDATEWVWSADVHVMSDWAYPSVGLALYDKNNAHDFIIKIIRLTPDDTIDNKDAQTCQLKIGNTDFGADSNGNTTQQWVETNKVAMKNEVKMALVHNQNGYYLFINGELVWSVTGDDAVAITSGWEEVNLGIFAEQESSIRNLTYSTDISSYHVTGE